MRNEFTAVVERDRRWYIVYCPEIPGANGQGIVLRVLMASCRSIPRHTSLDTPSSAWSGVRFQASC